MSTQAAELLLDPQSDLADMAVGSRRKAHGIHYTPSDLADFLARRALQAAPSGHRLRVLDPACGDGELLLAVSREASQLAMDPPELIGVDRDDLAVRAASERLGCAHVGRVKITAEDFLDTCNASSGFDLVISNPPYVRTQVLGAQRSRELAKRFDLSGRVDLYHAFVAAITESLEDGGVLALLCSNRFLTTKGGLSLRAMLLDGYDLTELWDLGDTKLFEAAVLPAVVVAKRNVRRASKGTDGSFVRMYEADCEFPAEAVAPSVLAALEGDLTGRVAVDDRRYTIERGHLSDPQADRPWVLTSPAVTRWLTTVARRSAGTLRDLGRIRVGIKTTADQVFIREQWDDLDPALRPESELLRPLITHRCAERWTSNTARTAGDRTVLYTHEVVDGRRRAIELERYPRAAAYLETHRARLEGRDYVAKAGRRWYEMWVPQDPAAWSAPKIVWPDISDRPLFFVDESGAVVNGDCYWLSCDGKEPDEIALAVAVANSSFALRFYDTTSGNRLYAGRRRFITQYLERLPMPQVTADELAFVAHTVSVLRAEQTDEVARDELELDLDAFISELFGTKESGW